MPRSPRRWLATAIATATLATGLAALAAPQAFASTFTSNITADANAQKEQGPCGNGGAGYDIAGDSQQSSSCYEGGESHAWCADFAGWLWQKAVALNADLTSGVLDNGAGSFYTYGSKYGTLHTSRSEERRVGKECV